MNQDPLHCLEVTKWSDLKDAFKSEWPRGITGYYALDTLEGWIKQGLDYGFRILNPSGEAANGMVAILKDEKDFIEMLIECPQDTKKLEKALKETKLLDWSKYIVVLFPQAHVVECLRKIAGDINMNVEWVHPLKLYVLDKETPLFNVSLPQRCEFKLLTEEFTDLIDLKWPHRYPGSTRYFQLLIQSRSGYGLFNDDQLICWGFVKEMGALGHIYTLEDHRRKGYGEMVTKLICNEVLKVGKDVFSFVIEENVESCKMHLKLGFKVLDEVYSVGLKNKDS